jgi:hypothetical protein
MHSETDSMRATVIGKWLRRTLLLTISAIVIRVFPESTHHNRLLRGKSFAALNIVRVNQANQWHLNCKRKLPTILAAAKLAGCGGSNLILHSANVSPCFSANWKSNYGRTANGNYSLDYVYTLRMYSNQW